MDDALDVFSLQAVPGIIGTVIGVGLFADSTVNPSSVVPSQEGAVFNNNWTLMGKQAAAGATIAAWTGLWTYLIMKVILRIVPQATAEEMRTGLDKFEHGVNAFSLSFPLS